MEASIRGAAVVCRSFHKLVAANPIVIFQRNFTAKVVTTEADKIVTHTGQKFEDGDYRFVRFTDKPKQVNERFAIDLIAEVAPQAIDGRSVFCDGGGGPLGHPKVYINLDKPGDHSCGYCGLRFHQQHPH